MNNLDGQLPVCASVYIDRHSPPQEEKVGDFVFSDMAELAAHAICNRFGYKTIVRFVDDNFPDVVYTWGDVVQSGVVRDG